MSVKVEIQTNLTLFCEVPIGSVVASSPTYSLIISHQPIYLSLFHYFSSKFWQRTCFQKVNYISSAKSRKGSWNPVNVLAAMPMMTWDIQQLVAWCPHTPLLWVVLAISQPCPRLPGSWNAFLGTWCHGIKSLSNVDFLADYWFCISSSRTNLKLDFQLYAYCM